MNTVEFAVRDGIPYAIDFMNCAPDADRAFGRARRTSTGWSPTWPRSLIEIVTRRKEARAHGKLADVNTSKASWSKPI